MMHFAIIILMMFSMVLGGCVTLKQPSMKIEYYTLEYDALSPGEDTNLEPVQAVLRVERFGIAPVFNTDRIIFRDQDFKRTSYSYHKWKANPADMVAYFLSRDLRRSGLFTAVVPHVSVTPHTHIVEGFVDEFLELDSKDDWAAVLSVNVTLMTVGEPDISKKIIFQQRFSARKKCIDKLPEALAQAMSEAMAEVTKEICIAVHKALSGKEKED